MCGIVGIASNKSVSANIVNSLKKLYFRPAINEEGPVLSRNIRISQRIDLRDGKYR